MIIDGPFLPLVDWSMETPFGLCQEPLVRWPWYHLNADASSVVCSYLDHRGDGSALVSNPHEFQELILIATLSMCKVSLVS